MSTSERLAVCGPLARSTYIHPPEPEDGSRMGKVCQRGLVAVGRKRWDRLETVPGEPSRMCDRAVESKGCRAVSDLGAVEHEQRRQAVDHAQPVHRCVLRSRTTAVLHGCAHSSWSLPGLCRAMPWPCSKTAGVGCAVPWRSSGASRLVNLTSGSDGCTARSGVARIRCVPLEVGESTLER